VNLFRGEDDRHAIALLYRRRTIDADGQLLVAQSRFNERLCAQRLDQIHRQLGTRCATIETQMFGPDAEIELPSILAGPVWAA
jgi:hypothetical protein